MEAAISFQNKTRALQHNAACNRSMLVLTVKQLYYLLIYIHICFTTDVDLFVVIIQKPKLYRVFNSISIDLLFPEYNRLQGK